MRRRSLTLSQRLASPRYAIVLCQNLQFATHRTEWQAGWVSGAILMPASAFREWSADGASKFGTHCPFAIESLPAADLIKTLVKRCDVSVLREFG
jgi:hypothetical protein